MRISTKGRYALRLLVDLARNGGDAPVALKDIAERQSLSKKYLEQIVPMLTKSGILHTSRGFQGGYSLARSAGEYTVGEILRITEGSLSPVACLSQGSTVCERAAECPTLPVWRGLEKLIGDYLDSITLAELAFQSPEQTKQQLI